MGEVSACHGRSVFVGIGQGLRAPPRRAKEERIRRSDGYLRTGPPRVRRLNIGKDLEPPAGLLLGSNRRLPSSVVGRGIPFSTTGREIVKGVVVEVEGKSNLLEVILARGSRGSFTDLLNCGQEQAQEHSHDGDDDE